MYAEYIPAVSFSEKKHGSLMREEAGQTHKISLPLKGRACNSITLRTGLYLGSLALHANNISEPASAVIESTCTPAMISFPIPTYLISLRSEFNLRCFEATGWE